jgi:molybdate transport system ATP-binding protein
MKQHDALRIALALDRADFGLRVDLTLPVDGITVLFGHSGSGKTSLLRCIAGLERARGVVALGGETWQDDAAKIFKPTWQRALGYVFQEASLFEHLDVSGNLLFGHRRSAATAGKQGDEHGLRDAVSLLGIGHLLGRTVGSLSGGERQRVAIARALATRPKLLLLDEPLASLDLARRQDVLPWLKRIRAESKTPMLYVTHAVDELTRLADHVVMLQGGAVSFSGPVQQAMLSTELALTIGEEAGTVALGVIAERSTEDQVAQVQFGGGRLWVRDPGLPVGREVRVRVLARDVSLALSEQLDSTIQNRLGGVIESVVPDRHPSQVLVRVQCGAEGLMARVTARSMRTLNIGPGSQVWCQVKSVALVV